MKINKMNKLFLVLGVGIGLVISSLLNMAYPRIKYEPYTEAQIIEKAKELGMVSIKEAITKNDEETVETAITDLNIEEDTTTNEDEQIVGFVINKGDNSEQIAQKLFEAGIIKDREKFIDKIIEKNVQKKFQYGVYELKIDMDYESLIKLLTRK